MTIQKVYDRYRLMRNLQQHLLRVAGVAKQIITSLQPETITEADQRAVVMACLLHDLGNIIKFDLSKYPEFLEPEGLAYWQRVQQEFRVKSGDDVVAATVQALRELKVSTRVIELVTAVGFTEAIENEQSDDLARKICAYADVRVTPFGVVSLPERLHDLRERYGKFYVSKEDQRRREILEAALYAIEEQIFARTMIRPEDITEVSIQPLMEDFPALTL